MFGLIEDPSKWLPGPGESNTVTLTSWEMSSGPIVQSGRGSNKQDACTGGGEFDNDPVIAVKRTS